MPSIYVFVEIAISIIAFVLAVMLAAPPLYFLSGATFGVGIALWRVERVLATVEDR